MLTIVSLTRSWKNYWLLVEKQDEIQDDDVLNILISKDVDDSGRTMVHLVFCEKLGTNEMGCAQPARCGRRHAHQSQGGLH